MEADAIVIGAGGAGLSAAKILARRQFGVILLEARDRVGGRVLSRQIPRTTTAIELGAEFIHGPAPCTMKLLRDAAITAVVVDGEAWTCNEAGELRRDDTDFTLTARALEKARSLARDETAERFLRRLEREEQTRPMAEAARAFVEGFEAADPATASARAIAEELRSGVDSSSSRPLSGYAPMFAHLYNGCAEAGVNIRLSTIVRRISWRRGAVSVDMHDSRGELRTIQARVAIVTLPVGVLRHGGEGAEVRFDPELPPTKREALRNIEMGQAVKVALWFRTAFWERINNGRYRGAAFFRGKGQPFATYWTQLPVRSELIVAWAGGPKAVALSGASEAEVMERALNGFGELFHEPKLARKEFQGSAMHDWDHDRFARGAYSYIVVGGGNARAAFAAPIDGTLFFAGEATSINGQGGTVNGALETGERAATEAAAVLGARTT